MDREMNFKCNVSNCSLVFSSMESRSKHYRSDHDKFVKCHVRTCFTLVREWRLNRHLYSAHGKQVDEMKVHNGSDKSVETKNSLKNSMDNLAKKSIKCNLGICKKEFPSLKARNIHIERVHIHKISCPMKNCSFILKKSSLIAHLKKIHGVDNVSITKEQKVKKTRDINFLDQAMNTGEIFRCAFDGCKKLFKTQLDKKSHEVKVHRSSIKRHQIDCERAENQKKIREHLINLKTEVDTTPYMRFMKIYKCTFGECEKAFRTETDRAEHLLREHQTAKNIIATANKSNELVSLFNKENIKDAFGTKKKIEEKMDLMHETKNSNLKMIFPNAYVSKYVRKFIPKNSVNFFNSGNNNNTFCVKDRLMNSQGDLCCTEVD